MGATPRVEPTGASVLAVSGWARLAVALVLSALLWTAVLWAIWS
jgi:hypothetical protein